MLNKSWRQHPTRHQLYGNLSPITKTNQVRRTRHAGQTHQWCTLMDPPHMAVQKQDDQHEHTFSSYVRIRDVVLKTCLGRWTIRKSGERGSGISMLPARHDDYDDGCVTAWGWWITAEGLEVPTSIVALYYHLFSFNLGTERDGEMWSPPLLPLPLDPLWLRAVKYLSGSYIWVIWKYLIIFYTWKHLTNTNEYMMLSWIGTIK